MLYIVIGILMLGVDIVTKLLAIEYLKPVSTLPIWEGVFHLTYVENRGAAFGMLQGARVFFIAITLIIIVAIFFFAKKYRNYSRCLDWSLTLVSAGAVGNLIDRIFRGFVVDFFDFCIIDYPVFNMADVFVCAGAGLLAIFIIFFEGKNDEN